MSPVFVVWFTVSILTLLAAAAVLVGLVRHVFGLGRTLRRFQEEVTPLAEEIAAEGDRAAGRASGLGRPVGGAESGRSDRPAR